MEVLIILEHRFAATPDGRVWTDGPFSQSFFRRYLEEFDRALVLARTRRVEVEEAEWRRADGPGVEFLPAPHWVGGAEYLLRRGEALRSLREALRSHAEAAVVLRAPSNLATLALAQLGGRPFAAEVVGDPYEAWSPGAVRHPLRPYLRWAQTRDLRRVCQAAAMTGYVTEAALQRRYPTREGSPTTHYSSVELPDEAFVERSRPANRGGRPLQLVCVGSMEHLYKGQDVLLEALAVCRGRGLDLELALVGQGRYRGRLEDRAEELGLQDRVEFLGALPAGAGVRAELDRADVFVLASRQEGLPRALLEAMARGLPAIATSVGGIPEVLPAEDLAPANDAEALAQGIEAFAVSPERRAMAGARNLERARDFRDAALQRRRNELFRRLRAVTSEWVAGGSGVVVRAPSVG
ncbi:MAG: glycosyltransferase [Acidobacteria bacterium]|nr:glycosyltransferase [Acidobacteriota bacterium]